MERLTLALVAHDAKKEDIVRLVKAHRGHLAEVNLIATRSTGRLIQERAGLPVVLLQSGPLGGDQQIGSLVVNGTVNAVVFLCDPLTAHPHEPDITALLRVCNVHNVPLATNLATAEAVMHFLAEHPEEMGKVDLALNLEEVVLSESEE
ncbi:MAG: methylglyoxal synthase [Chloroflexota bacterium]